MQNSVLERLLVVDYTIEIWIWNFENFMEKFGSDVEICWKSGTFDHNSLNNFLMSNIFLGQVYFFLKA